MAYLYLKKLKYTAFKSFAEKIELEFKDGMAIVLDPMAVEKSNIADTVRWVLGEQSSRKEILGVQKWRI